MQTDSIAVVVPVYNSEQTLAPLLDRLYPVLEAHGGPFEIILVNDGSADRSWEVIVQLAARWPNVRGLNLSRNFGQHNALLCGIRQARSDVIVTLDDDLQHPPEEIGKLMDKLREGFDVVYGTPQRPQHGWRRDASSLLTRRAIRYVTGNPVARQASSFRAFRTDLRTAFADYRSPSVAIDVLLSWGTKRFAAVPVRHEPRQVGVSNYTFRKLVAIALNLVTGFSIKPLRLATWLGFTCMLFGVLVFVYVIGSYVVHGSSVAGFPFLASIIATFSGVQLFALGIIGEYLGRMYLRLMERPAYVIQGVTPAERDPAIPAPDRAA
jgi:undecaprenyl-phosphate 4-deoxy-4-formamido-L-arabinose transferase